MKTHWFKWNQAVRPHWRQARHTKSLAAQQILEIIMIKIKPKDAVPKTTQLEELARQAMPQPIDEKSKAKQSVPDHGGLFDGGKTPPAKVKPELKQDAATKVLQEGVTGKDHGADDAMAKLPHMNVPTEND